MSDAKVVTAALIIIGNEILSGRTRDANLPWLAEQLTGRGVRLMEVRVIADIEDEIVATVNALRARYDYVFTTGGIGPTHDDITADSIAKAFGVAIDVDPEACARLEAHYADPAQLTEARLRMARIPAGAVLVDNPISAAPGFRIENVIVMAGVPMIMQAMFTGISHTLAGGDPILTRTVHSSLPEGHVAKGLGEVQARFPSVDLGSYPSYRAGRFSLALVARGTDPAVLDQVVGELASLITGLGGTPTVE